MPQSLMPGKQRLFTAGLVLFFLVRMVIFAQTSLPASPVIGVPYYADAARNALIPLQKEVGTIKTSSRALGYAGSRTRNELKGSRSGVRLSLTESPELMIRGVDPTRFRLFRLESRKDKRELQTSNNSFGGTTEFTYQNSEIPVSIVDCGQGCYKLHVDVAIVPGEYALSPDNSLDFFTFGVDSVLPPTVKPANAVAVTNGTPTTRPSTIGVLYYMSGDSLKADDRRYQATNAGLLVYRIKNTNDS